LGVAHSMPSAASQFSALLCGNSAVQTL